MEEAHAWALMGMNVFLGLRFAVWADQPDAERVAGLANVMLRQGIGGPKAGDE